MSARKKPGNFVQRLHRKIRQFFNAVTKAFVNWILRSLLLLQRPSRLSQAGFVLPTVVMVLLVVILLTTAIMFRSFDRSKNASNYRVDEAVLRAATPALDRARAKVNYLFSPAETGLQGNTPSEDNIATVLQGSTYTLGDETPLKLQELNPVVDDPDNPGRNVPPLLTAWKFPVDTDNNGKFDSFTLYGIYFHTPPLSAQGDDKRRRSPLEARAIPQQTGVSPNCAPGSGSAGSSPGWTPVSGQLKKAFFTYVATVPLTDPTQVTQLNTKAGGLKYEPHKGNKGFTALEMQLDQARIALDNNAVWYEDDLVITNVPTFNVNGRMHTNSNLMLSNTGETIKLRQVSSPDSCFYDPVNAKIIVGGNVAAGDVRSASDNGSPSVEVDLYPGTGAPTQSPAVSSDNKTTTANPPEVAANSSVFDQRLRVLADGAFNKYLQAYPRPRANASLARVQSVFTHYEKPDDYEADISKDFKNKCPSDACPAKDVLPQILESYFRKRIRRVSYSEISIDDIRTDPTKARQDASGRILSASVSPPPGETYVFSGLAGVAAPVDWMLIDSQYTGLDLKFDGATMDLAATKPQGNNKKETEIGDRIQVGNNLPQLWLKNNNNNPPEYAKLNDPQQVLNGGTPINWNNGGQRVRLGLARQLDDLGDTSRGGYWERAAAKTKDLLERDNNDPAAAQLLGGLRVVTGGGIYIDGVLPRNQGTGFRVADGRGPAATKSFLPPPPVTPTELKELYPKAGIRVTGRNKAIVVWPDTMPMYLWKPQSSGDPVAAFTDKAPLNVRNPGEGLKGDLQMRATVVYHYKGQNANLADQTLDPPIACISSYYDPTNPQNASNLQGLPLSDPSIPLGFSNNGVNYPVPPTSRQPDDRLRRQANMIFPDGRWANPALKAAIEQYDNDPAKLSVADIAAFDAANCALSILEPGAAPISGLVPDGAIKERAFLDARQVKALHKATVETDDKGNPILDSGTGLPIAIDDKTELADIAAPERTKIAELPTFKTKISTIAEPLPDRYTLPIEQRQPLEIRVTEIDLDQLRRTQIGGNTGGAYPNNNQEYLLPNSGLIYASREDALEDITDVDLVTTGRGNGASATDFKLDPTRRPNGIRLINSGNQSATKNGGNLARDNQFRTAEKGLILASNLPVYIKDDFNVHYRPGSNTLIEEFEAKLLDDYSNFYTRRDPKDNNFACRVGQKDKCATGDQWRAARILSDAITLLSSNFSDGFRSDGDYDLNNNAGNRVVKARLKNGFWWNGFATSAKWYDNATGLPKADFDTRTLPEAGGDQTSSYVMNGVTPIQRRVPISQGGFREYLMEGCTKLPVSECGPQDWVFAQKLTRELILAKDVTKIDPPTGGGLPKYSPRNSNAGTTARAPIGAFESAARRVAFRRNEFGALELQEDCSADPAKQTGATPRLKDCVAQARGISNAAGIVADYHGGNTPSTPAVPRNADNALWFWTTGDATNRNPSVVDRARSYDKTTQLFYLPYDAEQDSERQLLLPGTPEFPLPGTPEAPTSLTAPIPSLNGTTANDPSDFAVCIRSKFSKDYKVGGLSTGPCPVPRSRATTRALLTLRPTDSTVPTVLPTGTQTLKATGKVNVYDLPADGILGNNGALNLTLDRNNQSDPIFVFRKAAVLRPMVFGGGTTPGAVTLTLQGVDPNNIFWVSNTGVQISDLAHNLTGNFLGINKLTINGSTPQLQGVRFLGFNTSTDTFPAITTAMTDTKQPLLVPVLQLHSPKGRPSANTAAFGGSNDHINDNWLPHAARTTFNAALIMGDSPSRPASSTDPRYKAEANGGLGNFPHFLEAWEPTDATPNDQKTIARISGSLIQFKKSEFATAPFQAIDDPARDTSLFFDGATPDYTINYVNTDYRYKGGASGRLAPYYKPPKRQWGYDVGFLSQTPDLFSRRFGTPSAGTPSEFYRAVGRDDAWVQTLLCAAEQTTQPGGAGTPPPAYDAYAISDPKQRPSCPTLPYAQPLS